MFNPGSCSEGTPQNSAGERELSAMPPLLQGEIGELDEAHLRALISFIGAGSPVGRALPTVLSPAESVSPPVLAMYMHSSIDKALLEHGGEAAVQATEVKTLQLGLVHITEEQLDMLTGQAIPAHVLKWLRAEEVQPHREKYGQTTVRGRNVLGSAVVETKIDNGDVIFDFFHSLLPGSRPVRLLFSDHFGDSPHWYEDPERAATISSRFYRAFTEGYLKILWQRVSLF